MLSQTCLANWNLQIKLSFKLHIVVDFISGEMFNACIYCTNRTPQYRLDFWSKQYHAEGMCHGSIPYNMRLVLESFSHGNRNCIRLQKFQGGISYGASVADHALIQLPLQLREFSLSTQYMSKGVQCILYLCSTE